MKTTFTYAEHKEYGHWGWLDKSKPHFEPITGIGVIHDVVEHFPGGDGGIEDELQAFGAMWLIRGQNGLFLNGLGMPAYNTGSQIVGNSFDDIYRASYEGSCRTCPYRHRNVEHRDDWNQIRHLARRSILAEFSDDFGDGEHQHHTEADLDDMLDLWGPWFIHGMHRCEQRYKGLDLYSIGWHMNQAGKELDRLTAQCEEEIDDGRELDIIFVKSRMHIGFHLHEREYHY